MATRPRHSGMYEVLRAKDEDVYQDIIRIRKESRAGLIAGRVHKFKTGNHAGYFILRGNEDPKYDGKIIMDDVSRERLGNLNSGQQYEFDIREVGLIGEFRWAWTAVNPAYRIAARLGVISLVLGMIALIPLAWDAITAAYVALACTLGHAQ